jgi:RND family efflux transporter MFP subunit
MSMAETNLSRCTVKAPFNARIKSASVETGQFVAPGQHVLTLADDTVLEIQVPLDSRDARHWLQFETPTENRVPTAWFTTLRPVECVIRWTENKNGSAWTGILNRVVTFDQQTRTLTVAVRVTAESAMGSGNLSLPLVEGMFCTVEIPGRSMHGVYRLPRQAVSFENKVYLVDADSRLKTVAVSVARSEGENVYVSQGLNPGDTVITTRLIDPLENALLEIVADTVAKERAS